MLAFLVQGAGFGFAAGSIPGALHTFLISQTLAQGWRGSYLIPFSPLLTDAPIILLMVLVLGGLPAWVISGLQIVGGLYILHLARVAWGQARGPILENVPPAGRTTLWRAMVVNWLNPAPYIFWGAVTGPLLVEALDESLWHGALFLGGFYGVFIGIMVLVALVFHRLRALGERLVRGMLRVSAALLVFLGITFLLSGAGVLG
ncbi:MAG: LysE family translocator [Anaerolineales bacterium]